MPTHRLTRTWQDAGNESVTQQETITADGETNLDVAVPDSSTDLQANLAVDISELQSFYMSSDRDLTVKTNSSGTPDDTIALKANKPLIWTPNCGFSNPFSADLTALFLTNASGTDATLQVRLLQDVTP